MEFHIVCKDQQRLIFIRSRFPYSGSMAVRTAVGACRMAPPRRHRQPRAIGRVPTFHLDLMLLELRLHPGPAVGPSCKIDADPVRETSLQFEAMVYAIDGLRQCNTGISRQHFPLDPDNATSTAHTGRPDRNRHLWDSCCAATFHSKGGWHASGFGTATPDWARAPGPIPEMEWDKICGTAGQSGRAST